MATESFLPRSNGVVNSVIQCSKELLELGHQVEIICPGEGPNLVNGVKVHRVSSFAVDPVAQVDFATVTVGRIRTLVERFQPDVVHCASPVLLGEKVAKISRALGIPTVAIFQTDLSGFALHYGMNAWLAKKLIDKRVKKVHEGMDLTLAPSIHSRDYLENLGVSAVKIWRRGVDLAAFTPKLRSEAIRASWNREPNTVFVGYVGRLAPEKKIMNMGAISRFESGSRRNVQLVFIGDGPSKNALQEQFPDGVFTGKLSGVDLYSSLASLDVVVTTGENETFCQVIQEGFASALPVVAPAIGGPLDLVEHDETGFLYHPGNQRELAEYVSLLVNDESKRMRMGLAAQAKVQNRSWRALTVELLAHYQSVITPEFHREKFHREKVA